MRKSILSCFMRRDRDFNFSEVISDSQYLSLLLFLSCIFMMLHSCFPIRWECILNYERKWEESRGSEREKKEIQREREEETK